MNMSAYQQPPTQKKQIQITNITSKPISFTDRATGQPKSFTLFQIQANDGLTYETGDGAWAAQRKVGESLEIEYIMKTNVSNGQVFTNYKIMTPRAGGGEKTLEALRLIYGDLQLIKRKLGIPVTETTAPKPVPVEPIATVTPDTPLQATPYPTFEDDAPINDEPITEANNELQVAADETQNVEPPPKDLPF